jgi:hypothetical protein
MSYERAAGAFAVALGGLRENSRPGVRGNESFESRDRHIADHCERHREEARIMFVTRAEHEHIGLAVTGCDPKAIEEVEERRWSERLRMLLLVFAREIAPATARCDLPMPKPIECPVGTATRTAAFIFNVGPLPGSATC